MTDTHDYKLLKQAETNLRGAAREESELLESIAASLLVIARRQSQNSVEVGPLVHSFTPVPPGLVVEIDWDVDKEGNIHTSREPLFGWFLVYNSRSGHGMGAVPAIRVEEVLEPLDVARGWRIMPAEERRDD